MDYIFLQAASGISNMIFIGAMIVVMYFFLIRPQQQKQKKQEDFVNGMQKGDKVVTTSGIHGKIMEINPENGVVTLLIDKVKGVTIQIQKSGISKELSEAFQGGE
jgi:preprotein translocase subunit YajC